MPQPSAEFFKLASDYAAAPAFSKDAAKLGLRYNLARLALDGITPALANEIARCMEVARQKGIRLNKTVVRSLINARNPYIRLAALMGRQYAAIPHSHEESVWGVETHMARFKVPGENKIDAAFCAGYFSGKHPNSCTQPITDSVYRSCESSIKRYWSLTHMRTKTPQALAISRVTELGRLTGYAVREITVTTDIGLDYKKHLPAVKLENLEGHLQNGTLFTHIREQVAKADVAVLGAK